MKLNPRENTILRILLREEESQTRPAVGTQDDAAPGFVPIAAARWFGDTPSTAESVAFHRVCKRLESLGLLERANLRGAGERTSHLRLTEAGKATAREIRDHQTIDRASNGKRVVNLEDQPFFADLAAFVSGGYLTRCVEFRLGGVPMAVLLDSESARCALVIADRLRETRPPFTREAIDAWLDGVLKGLDVSEFMSASI